MKRIRGETVTKAVFAVIVVLAVVAWGYLAWFVARPYFQ
jgi:hypothetical protein